AAEPIEALGRASPESLQVAGRLLIHRCVTHVGLRLELRRRRIAALLLQQRLESPGSLLRRHQQPPPAHWRHAPNRHTMEDNAKIPNCRGETGGASYAPPQRSPEVSIGGRRASVKRDHD